MTPFPRLFKKRRLPAPTISEITVEGIGKVIVRRTSGTRAIRVYVKSQNEVLVSMPKRGPLKAAGEFVLEKREWIRKQRSILAAMKPLPGFENKAEAISAANSLKNRLMDLAEMHGFTYKRATIRRQKSRWGSCSAKGTISLNIKLARLPDELRDYVMLHELVHTRVQNHSARFWMIVKETMPDSGILKSRLREYKL